MATVTVYPNKIRILKGRSKTVCAAYRDNSGAPVYSQTFTAFQAASTAIANLTNARVTDDVISTALTAPPNLREIYGVAAGSTTVTATGGGITSAPVTVVVDDPDAAPVASIKEGDGSGANISALSAKVGEAIELNFEGSAGCAKIAVDWGDGDKTTEQISATHCYLSGGVKTVTLTITNSSGATATATCAVTVSAFSAPTQIITVTSLAALLSAYNSCTGGETIKIAAGSTLSGSIVLPAKNLTDYVTISSDGTMPDIRDRISKTSNQLATIKGSGGYNTIPVTLATGTKLIRFIGIKFEPQTLTWTQAGDAASTYVLCSVGQTETGTAPTDVSGNPTRIIFQHCVMNPQDNVDVIHGLLNDGYKTSCIACYFGNVKSHSNDAQAVYSGNGRGAHVYNNCYLEGSGENVIYGGSQPSIEGLTGTNVEFRRCYLAKPDAWKANSGGVYPIAEKNIFEIKNGRRIYLEGCILENHWDSGRSQTFAVVFKSAVTSGGDFIPQAICEDVVLENCIIRKVYGAFDTADDVPGISPFLGLKPVNNVVKNCLIDDISTRYGFDTSAYQSRLIQPNNGEYLRFDHCTVIDKDNTLSEAVYFVRGNTYGFALTNSILPLGNSGNGIYGGGGYIGNRALNFGSGSTQAATNNRASDATWNVKNNAFVANSVTTTNFPNNTNASGYPNSYPANNAAVGFNNLAGGDYSLASGSAYKNAASDGTDLGADFTVLNARTANTVSGAGSSSGGGSSSPVASFTKSASSITSGGSVTFTDTSGGTPTSWLWNFGDGSATSTVQNPTHTFASTGTFAVTLTATNATGSNSATQTVTVTSSGNGRKIVNWANGVIENTL